MSKSMTRPIKDTNVCVVGGAGFLGSHIVPFLAGERNCKVHVIDNLCVGVRDWVDPRAEFMHHDITGSEEFLTKYFQKNEIQYVFNYAAWPYIPDSFDRPLQVFSVNTTGAIKVINAAHAADCQGILQISSAELYGEINVSMSGISEEAPVIPHSTYGAAKAAVDYYCQSAWRERETPVIALRQFNCVGERETHPYVIPEIISQVSKHNNIYLGNNSARDFLYAEDQARMAVELLEKGEYGEVYNLGSQRSIKIYDLANLIAELMGKKITIHEDEQRKRPWEIWHLLSDNTKIHKVIDARPKVKLEEALERTIRDYLNYGWSWV